MPVYAFECRGCGHRFELLRSIRDRDTVAKCPACQCEETERVLAPFSFAGFQTYRGDSSGFSAPT